MATQQARIGLVLADGGAFVRESFLIWVHDRKIKSRPHASRSSVTIFTSLTSRKHSAAIMHVRASPIAKEALLILRRHRP